MMVDCAASVRSAMDRSLDPDGGRDPGPTGTVAAAAAAVGGLVVSRVIGVEAVCVGVGVGCGRGWGVGRVWREGV